ncbi:hypothetical protein [Mucilaginibacter conchicola]|uniref:hypothetical protein n=1 Tax=Mucilaginibacter conchicola TaxID=2303333 RepID=UPI001F404812|nr:hypothetical protein [Mucilaginibacter conchicola]
MKQNYLTQSTIPDYRLFVYNYRNSSIPEMALKNAQPKDLALHVLEKLEHSRTSLLIPPLGILESLFTCLFFTSMRTEESDLVRLTVTLIDPADPDPKPPRQIVPERWSSNPFGTPI